MHLAAAFSHHLPHNAQDYSVLLPNFIYSVPLDCQAQTATTPHPGHPPPITNSSPSPHRYDEAPPFLVTLAPNPISLARETEQGMIHGRWVSQQQPLQPESHNSYVWRILVVLVVWVQRTSQIPKLRCDGGHLFPNHNSPFPPFPPPPCVESQPGAGASMYLVLRYHVSLSRTASSITGQS